MTGGVVDEVRGPVFKYRRADFLVRENLTVPLDDSPDAPLCYLLLRKEGYTTAEAVGLVAERFQVPRQAVTYAGLKDEDGITEQLVAVPSAALTDQVPALRGGSPVRLTVAAGRRLELTYYGRGSEPLRIGALEGNSFRAAIRGLDREQADRLVAAGTAPLFFLNYYDVQRFGVPGGAKRTHLVGAALLRGDWSAGLAELAGLGAPESAGAAAWSGPPREFFDRLDSRTASFYLAAHASQAWNAELNDRVGATCPGQHYRVRVEGIDYLYATSVEAAMRVLVAAPTLPYKRYEYRDGEHHHRSSHRSTVVQTRLRVTEPEPDEAIDGAYRVTASFALPSGCYATAALRQWFGLAGCAVPGDDRPATAARTVSGAANRRP